MRRSMGLVLAVILSLTFTIPSFAAMESKTEAEATALNQLNLLKGDGNGFNLSGNLKRSEAAAFIVKLMGNEAYVLAHKTSFPDSKLSDVDRSAWYAPFVEYCVQQKIIAGFPDKTFRPNENISEKAFLSLVLHALLYGENEFTWSTVYQVAFNVGIVTDSKYQTAKDDNLKYLRGNVVNVLYRTLTVKFKGLSTMVIEQLIRDHVVTQAMAVSSGVLKE